VAVAGSDAHFKEEIGMAGIMTETDNIFECIRTDRVKTFYESSSKIVHMKSIVNRIINVTTQVQGSRVQSSRSESVED